MTEARSKRLLWRFSQACLGDKTFEAPVEDFAGRGSGVIMMKFTGPMVSVPGATKKFKKNSPDIAAYLEEAHNVADVLIHCFQLCRTETRRRVSARQAAKMTRNAILGVLGDLVEAHAWPGGDPLRLPELLGPEGGRRRASVQKAVAMASRARKRRLTVGALSTSLSDTNAAAAHRRGEGHSMADQLLYHATCLEQFRNDKHVGVTMDGVTVGGMSVNLYAYWSHRLGKACWLPVQDSALPGN